ncbi:hypothetical protein PVAP13_1KG520204 [Panicum virgatum]|uniref:Uncharacterized protein n=1 Tax=Panicum virgatum TaxID=38727 RepID=A0A8T0XRG7_PANVG|nr:hypothetical protein PVAP13_1KG520204 [Panicum virgatum]
MRHRKISSVLFLLLLLLVVMASCALSFSASRWSHPPRPAWARQGREGRRLQATAAAARASRRLGQRLPVKQPPSPNPNGMTTMVKPGSPPAPLN